MTTMVSDFDFMQYDDKDEAVAAVDEYNAEERERTQGAMGSVATLDWLDENGPYVVHVDNLDDGRSQHGNLGNVCMYVRVNGDVF